MAHSVNSEKILNYMKEHYGQEMTKQQIAEALGLSVPTVTGTINSLVKNERCTKREETYVAEEATETRKEKIGKRVWHTLTEAGLAFDPVAEDEAREAEKARIKAEKAAAKAAAQAE